MPAYIVRRHGCNAANQHMTPVMVVGTYEAAHRQAAIDAARGEVTVYNNQYLDAVLYSRASKALKEEARSVWEQQALAEGSIDA